MTVIKLPIKRLADLEAQIAQLQQHIERLNGRHQACVHLIEHISTMLPDDKRRNIYEAVKSLTDFHANHPTHLEKDDYRGEAFLQVLREFEGYFFWSVYSPNEYPK
ncbi:hypothetical protein Q7267_01985 [Glaesserella parasuis]|uniref:hypothetical protein n=2 Tax=Glaesserella parasuis TaxID=738 RepID=UPI0013540042|nr:hypothetical protein [Glaesserella parasuis]MDO9648973.1 hypothetical protein [Glaesserella parasuis]MDO9656629.1 hypothetical protein [Glaesserella parasuis]MDO9658509.1 hypothetical protein [Glaesserella parasuis]MDO9667878.1 hypothetical protein [Glaesserella parasuis]MDO9700020.1 hypothetical protein [Glaesserella parasuis]